MKTTIKYDPRTNEDKKQLLFETPVLDVNHGWEDLNKLYQRVMKLYPGYDLYNNVPNPNVKMEYADYHKNPVCIIKQKNLNALQEVLDWIDENSTPVDEP